MKYPIIGIAGNAQVGKDTAADYIKGKLPYNKASFADPIKAMLKVGLGLSHAQLHDGDLKEVIDDRYNCTPRQMMQTLGTEWGREMIDQNIWVDAMREHVKFTDEAVIIPDVRFESEAKMIREEGILIHIQGIPKIGTNHASEQGIYTELGDIIIKNDASIDEYYLKLEKLVRKHLK